MYARVSAVPLPADRPPVILVHGLVISSRYMVPLARRLAPDFQVYAPDLPGFGNSAKPPFTLTLSELADALAEWMTAAGLTRAALVGNSVGCQILAEFALRHPTRADRLVLIGPTVDPAARTARQQLARTFLNSRREPRSLVDRLRQGRNAAGDPDLPLYD
jgi:2-hydroxy-6-oxonona-2,4-dienedioate hydrolase